MSNLLEFKQTYLNYSGHLLREDVKQFDFSRDPWAIFSMSKQSESETQIRKISMNRLKSLSSAVLQGFKTFVMFTAEKHYYEQIIITLNRKNKMLEASCCS